jgi:hypothetical protein
LPDRIADRLDPKKGGKSWDVAILSIVGIGTIARLVAAGPDTSSPPLLDPSDNVFTAQVSVL